MEVSFDDVHAPSMRTRMEENGLTDVALIKQLKKELKAHVTKTAKLRGAVTTGSLPKKHKILAQSGLIITTKDGDIYGDGDTVIAWNEVDWSTRQRARMDAHRLRGDYPAEKHELGGPNGGPIQFTDLERANRLAYLIEQAKKRKEG